jgi:hypothetical protein
MLFRRPSPTQGTRDLLSKILSTYVIGMSRCSALTQVGERCKNVCTADHATCRSHVVLGECPICIESMTHRTSRYINCNHRFHKTCLNRWKDQGKRTCPVCRHFFDCSRFKVTISVVDLDRMQTLSSELDSSMVNTLINSSNINFDTVSTDMVFSLDDLDELDQLLADLGTTLTNLDASPLNAESMAELFVI